MLDRASLRKLAQFPEGNDPMLNVALAEEGPLDVLLSLASCGAIGPQALSVICERVENEGSDVGVDREEKDPEATGGAEELDGRLIAHLNAPDAVRDAVLARHDEDPFFLLAAGSHPRATLRALDGCARWASVSPLHDRPWAKLLSAAASAPTVLEHWARDDELARETAALLSRDAALLATLARDPSRRVRRAVAGNAWAAGAGAGAGAGASDLREALCRDLAPEVRARASGRTETRIDPTGNLGSVDPDRFAAALAAMRAGGALAHDVVRAIVNAGPELDEEGALLGARFFDKDGLLTLVGLVTATDQEASSARGVGVGAGLALRSGAAASGHESDDGTGNEISSLTNHIVHLVTRSPSQDTRLTGKARAAWWMAESLARSRALPDDELLRGAAPGTLAGDRMVLARSLARRRRGMGVPDQASVPAPLVELCWADPSISDEQVLSLAARIAPAARQDRELPEDELDLAPGCRSLGMLERTVFAAIVRAPVSPRAALAAIALEPRRVRYILTAMPTWKGKLTGSRLARVLRSHAGALSAAAPASTGAHAPSVARWTDRRLSEVETAVAIAVGDLTIVELLRRLAKGTVTLQDGVTLAAAVEARAAIDGPGAFGALLEHAAARRTSDPSALALWMLLETLDRPRAASLIATSLDGLSGSQSVVPPGVCEALATLERRAPGRLETVFPQSPRGRATVASAIARAYRALGGMRDEA